MMYRHFALVLLLLTGSVLAHPVARVDSIDGSQGLAHKKGEAAAWAPALVDSQASAGDHLRTDAFTQASLQFYLGGRANLEVGTEIAILNSKETEVVAETILLNSGTFWGQFDKQKTPIKIQTAGGVMGIRGTEFVVTVADDGDTDLSLLEGEVEVMSASGESHVVRPGQRVRFGRRTRLRVSQFTPQELLEKLRGELSPRFFQRRALFENMRERHGDGATFRERQEQGETVRERAQKARENRRQRSDGQP